MTKNVSKKSNLGNFIIKMIAVLVLVIIVSLLALLLYGIIGKGYGFGDIIDVVKSCWEKAEVYIPSIAAVFTSATAVSVVKLGQLISAANDYSKTIRVLQGKVNDVESLFVETVKEINSRYKKAQEIEKQKNDINQAMLLTMMDSIYDEDVKIKLEIMHKDYVKLNENEEKLLQQEGDQ